jgi:hypothetical protein
MLAPVQTHALRRDSGGGGDLPHHLQAVMHLVKATESESSRITVP